MKFVRKTIAILLVLVMCVSLMCMTVSAAEPSGTDVDMLLAEAKAEAAGKIFAGMMEHKSNISFTYAIKYEVSSTKAVSIVAYPAELAMATVAVRALLDTDMAMLRYAALAHNMEVPAGGDYLSHQCSSFKVSYSNFNFSRLINDGIVIVDVNIKLEYRDTEEQEKAVNAAIADILEDFAFDDGARDYDKVKTIYDWMYKNIGFDSVGIAFYDTTPEASGAYAAIVKGATTSEGFASVFYRLCLASGVDCRIISSNTDNLPHTWNIVKIDGNWYYIDSSRGEGNGEYLFPYPKFAEDYWRTAFFLKGAHYWSNMPVFTAGDQYDNPITHPGFAEAYPVSESSYNGGEEHKCSDGGDAIVHPEKTNKEGEVTAQAYYECRECGKIFSDKDCTQELEKVPEGQSSFNIGGLFGGLFAKIINFFRSLFPFC